jgi:hypothetical protein
MSRDEYRLGSTPDRINRLYIVLVDRAHVLGGRVFDSQSEASSAMAEEAEQAAKREARKRRRTVALRIWSDHARVEVGESHEVGREQPLFHTLSFHGSL